MIDDDPTGCQTVHDIPILTAWPVEALKAEFNRSPCFFILTNSRSLPAREAIELNREVARNIVKAASSTGRRFMVISRSDSTLRGHLPGRDRDAHRRIRVAECGETIIPPFSKGGGSRSMMSTT